MLILSLGCYSSKDKINIEGNWYMYKPSFSYDEEGIAQVNKILHYEEIFIDDKKIYNYLNFIGYVSPSYYFIKGDSLFSSLGTPKKSNFKFKGKIKKISENAFLLFDSDFSVIYKKVKDSIVLENYLIKTNVSSFKDSNNDFAKAFLKREQSIYSSKKQQ